MANCVIVGINWGDEGKGRMVDLLTDRFDGVVRYQGGGNAGHTVINEYGKFALHLLPSARASSTCSATASRWTRKTCGRKCRPFRSRGSPFRRTI